MSRRRRPSRTGGVLVWKPVGPSSREALDRAERAIGAGALGHTGTLDPLAEGLLLLLGGEARKFQALLTDHDKSYRARVSFGVVSASDDAEGPLHTPVPRGELPDRAAIERALDRFRGGYAQVPPGHSAIHIGGERAWAKARRGETVELPPRDVQIRRIELLEVEEGDEPPGVEHCSLEVDCGPGTYIRSLARDLGDALGCGAHLSGLVRHRLGGLDEEGALPLGDVGPGTWHELEELLAGLPRLEVGAEQEARLALGQRVPHPLPPEEHPGAEPRVIWCEGRVVGIGEMRGSVIQPRRWLPKS
ncbi:MAG: tRNA pseudouridine(55) synthase TruB [Planctomycetota bacterium]